MRFGILGTAGIARGSVVPAIVDSDHEAVAVASRDADRARAFADDFGIDRAHGEYATLLDDDGVDAVYVPLPNALHAEWTKRAADRGKHVLCEKPLGVDAAEAREMGQHCDRAGVTLMEAFMYRYHPMTERASALVEEELGTVRSVKADFQFPLYGDPENVRLNPELAGGSLMDVGCYAVNAARLFLGEPEAAHATTADTRDSGVETHLAGVLEYADGATATVTSSFDTATTQRYRIETADGYLAATDCFNTPDGETTLRYAVDGREVVETFDPADAYRAQVEHFAACVENGTTPRTDARAAARNMAAIDALYESAEEGRTVAVRPPS
jgi:xylose dehydrogenase (NAD/NADP)